MSFPRKTFTEGVTYHEADWDELQNNIGNYYDALCTSIIALINMDFAAQGTNFIKLSAAEYAKYLTGFYDILDQTTTIKFGHGRDIEAFYFANGDDADGANIYANDLFSRGFPVYVLVYASPWHILASGADTGLQAHSLGFRPSFGMLQVAHSDPTGAVEEYVYTESYACHGVSHTNDSYAAWNNSRYRIYNRTDHSRYFRVLLFAYMGS